MNTSPSTEHRDARREAGFTVIEVVIAATIFAIALMSTGLTLLHGVRSQDESEDFTLSLRAARDISAEVQDLANLPNDVTMLQGIGSVYVVFNGMTRTIPELPMGTITLTCFGNEPSVPTELGGPQDLNFDGDANDNLANQSNGSDLKIVPARIDVSFTDERGTVTQTYFRSFTQTTD